MDLPGTELREKLDQTFGKKTDPDPTSEKNPDSNLENNPDPEPS